MKKCHDQGNSKEKVFYWGVQFRGCEEMTVMVVSMAAGSGRHAAGTVAEITSDPQAESRQS